MTQEDKPWQTRWDENGWKSNSGLSPNYTPKEYSQEELDAILMEAVPKSDLTEEQFNEAKRIWESEKNMPKTVKYLQSVKFGNEIKLAYCYFDLYIGDRDYDKIWYSTTEQPRKFGLKFNEKVSYGEGVGLLTMTEQG